MYKSRRVRLLQLSTLVLLGILPGGCVLDPSSDPLGSDLVWGVAAVPDPGRGTGLLVVNVPWPWASEAGAIYRLDAAPVGADPSLVWSRRTIGHQVVSRWGPEEEYWYAWFLLDGWSVHRDQFELPSAQIASGPDALFSSQGGNRWTRYLSPAQAAPLRQNFRGTDRTLLLGLQWDPSRDDTLVVGRVAVGSNAQRAGITRDDRLLAVDGSGSSNPESLFVWLSNPDSLHVFRLRFRRPSTDSDYEVSVRRGLTRFTSVYLDTLRGIPYVSIEQFIDGDEENSADLFRQAVTEILTHSADRWILDLRGNPGGDLEACRRIASLLIDDGDTLVLLDTRSVGEGLVPVFERTALRASREGGPPLANRHLDVLIDAGSASSSEILLAALRANIPSDRLRVVGDTTYGKGVGQSIFDMPSGGLAMVTSLRMIPLRQEDWEGIGIEPDEVVVSDRALASVLPQPLARAEAGQTPFLTGVADRLNLATRPKVAPDLVPEGRGPRIR